MNENRSVETRDYETEHFGYDEIELMDILLILWKWRYLIIGGTIAVAVMAAVYSFLSPKVYNIRTVMQPGILNITEQGKKIYIDSPNHIKDIIDTGTYDSEILKSIEVSHGNDLPKSFELKVKIPKKSNILSISYETSDVPLGLDVVQNLNHLLLARYGKEIDYYQKKYDMKIHLTATKLTKLNNKILQTRNDISSLEAEKEEDLKKMDNKISTLMSGIEAKKDQVLNLQKRIADIDLEIGRISQHTDLLVKERDAFLATKKTESYVLSSMIYTNTIQQNINYLNSLRDSTNDINNQIYEQNAEIQSFENTIKDLKAQKESVKKQTKYKIDNLESKIKDLESEKGYTVQEIEVMQFQRNSIQNLQILQPPESSSHPIRPREKLNVVLGAVLGLFFTIFLSFFLEYISKHKKQDRIS